MRPLADKVSSTIVVQHAKVPYMAWSGIGIDEVELSEKRKATLAKPKAEKMARNAARTT
jgi:acetyl-CoA carboxylase/biotin carboxylase 1